jgi:hypothetical protein
MKKFLFDAIRRDDMSDVDGTFYKVAWDRVIFYPATEMTPPERRLFYDKILYIYNMGNPQSVFVNRGHEQQRVCNRLISQKAYGLHPRYPR